MAPLEHFFLRFALEASTKEGYFDSQKTPFNKLCLALHNKMGAERTALMLQLAEASISKYLHSIRDECVMQYKLPSFISLRSKKNSFG